MSIETHNAHGAATAVPPRTGRWPKWLNPALLIGLLATLLIGLSSLIFRGPPFITTDQGQVLIKGVDIDQTLVIAEREMQKGGFASVLTLWGIRDQVYTEAQAKEVADHYFRHIASTTDYFQLWHLTWAISNIYRNGDVAVRAQLQPAYDDATQRAKAAGGIADAHVNGNILIGDIHFPARWFVQTHVVAPGTQGYLQSLADYKP
jgi:hypothetical protein